MLSKSVGIGAGATVLRHFIWVVATALALASCGSDDKPAAPPQAAVTACLNASDPNADPLVPNATSPDGRIVITNVESELDTLIACASTEIVVDNATVTPTGGPGAPIRVMAKVPTVFNLTLVAAAPPPKIVGMAARVSVAGLDDLTAGGTYTGPTLDPPYVRYLVEIDFAGAPDRFHWSVDGGASSASVPITGAAQALSDGVTVTFAATTGHTATDQWQIDAGTLQATSVAMKGNSAVVSYGMIGPPFLGAIQVYDLTGNAARLKSQALIRDMDINAVEVSGTNAYAVGAREPVTLYPAVIESLTLSGSKLQLGGYRTELHSFAGTGVLHDAANNKVLVTDGNNGGLSVLNDTTLVEDLPSYTALADARGVALEGATAVVVQGCCGPSPVSNGQVTVFDMASGTPSTPISYPIVGADIPDSKSTVDLVGGKAIIAAGSGGAQVLDTADGTVLATIALPTVPGLTADRVVANAVTVSGDLMFISNGEAGVYVAQAAADFSASSSSGPVSLTALGQLQFGSLESVNHVAYDGAYLFVAAGLGGLKIVSVTVP